MTIEEFRDEVIRRGIESVKANETDPEIIAGALEGFEICKAIELKVGYWIDKLEERRKCERQLNAASRDTQYYDKQKNDDYWRYRYGTLQIEHVFERLKVCWAMQPLSARAVIDYADIVGVADVQT